MYYTDYGVIITGIKQAGYHPGDMIQFMSLFLLAINQQPIFAAIFLYEGPGI